MKRVKKARTRYKMFNAPFDVGNVENMKKMERSLPFLQITKGLEWQVLYCCCRVVQTN